MGRFTVIPQDAFNGLQTDAGVLLKRFNPAAPAAPNDEDIICATTGGVNPQCVATYSDYGKDVDNVPNNMMEFKHLDGWDCKIATTSLGTTPELIKLSLGAADIPGSNSSKIVPRRDLAQTDFSDIWWVGDRADGGLVAIRLMNALSTGGFSLQTNKNGKGQISIELTGHVSINAQSVVPMEFYSIDPEDVTAYRVTQILSNVTSDFEGSSIAASGSETITLTAAQGKSFANVVVLMGGADVTASKYNDSTHKITLSSLTGDIEIIATAT